MPVVYRTLGIVLAISIISIALISIINPTKRRYNKLVVEGHEQSQMTDDEIITASDLDHLPTLVRKYLNYVGVVGNTKVHNFQLTLSGEMKMKKDGEFQPYKAVQTTFLDQGTRLFYMDLWLNRIKVSGLHHFNNDNASMKIKLLDVIKVVDESGEVMQKAETVTYFNDMVVFAPQSLINEDILWEQLDESTVKATFTHNDITITAKLFFDDEGKLINFISDDRLALESEGLKENVPWSTPISSYHQVDGLNLPRVGKGIWHYDEGDFTYITLTVKNISYNVTKNE